MKDLSLLQKVVIPSGIAPLGLYIRTRYPELWFLQPNELIFQKRNVEFKIDEHIAFNTFFGAFSLTTWMNKPNIKEIVISIQFSGEGIVTIWHDNGYEPPFYVMQTAIKGQNQKIDLTIDLKKLSGKTGIIFPEITILSESFSISKVFYFTTQKPTNNVRMALIMPTFNREIYVKRNFLSFYFLFPSKTITKFFIYVFIVHQYFCNIIINRTILKRKQVFKSITL